MVGVFLSRDVVLKFSRLRPIHVNKATRILHTHSEEERKKEGEKKIERKRKRERERDITESAK